MINSASSHLPRLDLDTDQMPAGSGLAAWASAMLEYELAQPEGADPLEFRLRATAWLLGDVIISQGRVTAISFTRSGARARADGVDTCNLILFTTGTTVGDVEGRLLTLGPGQVLSMDCTHASAWHASDNDFITVSIARMALLGAQPRLPDFHGRLLESPSGRLLVDYLIALVRQLPNFRAEDSRDIADATITLVKAAFAALPARTESDDGDALRQRVRRAINQNLTNGKLTPALLAEDLGVSRSVLYASCEPLGGISNYIKRRRLEAVRALLIDPEERRTLSDLAEGHGFKTLSHFSEAFRQAFGQSPGAIRKHGPRMSSVIIPHDDGDTVDAFRGWMRKLAAR